MKRMVSLAAGVAVGYVLGSRAGREKYEQIAAAARRYGVPLPAGATSSDAGATSTEPSAPPATATASPRRSRPSRARSAAEKREEREELRVAAKELVEDMPGETALGNADPAAGGHGDPKAYEGR